MYGQTKIRMDNQVTSIVLCVYLWTLTRSFSFFVICGQLLFYSDAFAKVFLQRWFHLQRNSWRGLWHSKIQGSNKLLDYTIKLGEDLQNSKTKNWIRETANKKIKVNKN